MNKNLTEHQIQTQLIHWLQAHRFYVQRLNAGQYALGEGKSRRFVQGVATGTPDLLAFRTIHEKILITDGGHSIDRDRLQLLFIEVKRPGKKLTVIQSAKMDELEEYGARCFVATSIEDVEREIAL